MKFNPSNTDHIGIEFKVWAPHLTRVTKKLFLLGSLKELGAWDIDKAIQAYPTTDMHTWNVEVSVPAMSQFEWTWLTTNLNRTGVDWEKTTKRARTVDCFSGTLHTIYGDGEEVFLQTATCLEVTTYMRVEEGLTMVLTGSTPSTGEWDLHFAKQATEFPQRSGYWKVHVTFDALTNLEFKWAVVKEKDHGVLYVQEKLPHSIFGRKSWLRAVAPWNTSLVIVVDTSLLCDLTDTMLGRTEIIVKERKRRGQEIKSWLVKAESGKGTPVRSPRPPPSPVERLTSTAPLSIQIQPTRISLPVTPSLASSVTSLTHVPSVQRTLDLDEHVRQRQDSLSKLERLTQQLSKVYTEENTVYAIKGMGQTELATDKLNSDLFMPTSEGIVRAYGETAEMTSLHLLPSSASSKHRQKYPLLGYDHHEKAARQPGERSLTRLLKSEEMPKLQEGEALSQVRGFSVSEDNNEEEGLVPGATQEVMPLCVTSQTVADTVPSDTGFTELSSWMSSIKTDVTASESALSSSHTMTCLLGADANNVSDGEESRSDHMTLPTRRLDTLVDSMTNYWETQQRDLSPPWLNKSQAGIQGGSGDFMVDCLDAMEEDYVHLEWLASRLEEEINYEMLQFGTCVDSVPQIPVEDAFLFRHEKIPSVQDFRNDHAKWSPSSPPKASPKIRSPLSFTLDKDDDSSREPSEQDLLSESESHAFEDEETIEKRSIARALEAQWGASYYRASEGQSVKNILSVNLPSWKNGTEKCPSYPVSVGLQGTMHSEWKKDKLTYYSFSELSDMLLPEADAVDHRAMAREAERLWGEGLTRKMQASHEGDAPVTILNITNQVPILEGGVTLLMYSKPEYWTEPSDVVSGHASPVLERRASLRSKSVVGSRGSSVDVTEIQEEVEEKSSSLSVQQFLKTLLSADTLLSGVDIIKRKFTDIGQLSGYDRAPPPPQQSAMPLIEKEIRLITSYPPPTFSMLQEQAEEVTRHPVISTPRRKITITRVYTPQGSKPRTPPEPASLFEKFKQKSQESFLTEKASSYRGPFSPSRGQSSPSLPSSVGVDDILKSPRDVKDEQINRRLWDKMRERANKEEEEKRNKQKMP